MSRATFIYDDSLAITDDIHALTGVEHYGELLHQRRQLHEHVLEKIGPDYANQVHLRSAADRDTLLLSLGAASSTHRYVYWTADVVGDSPKALTHFLAKLSFTNNCLLGIPDGAQQGSVVATMGPALLRALLQTRTLDERASFLAEHGEQFTRLPTNGLCSLADTSNFVQFLSGSFYTRNFNTLSVSGRQMLKQSADREKMKGEHDYWYLLPSNLQRFIVQPFEYQEDAKGASYRMERLNVPDMAILWIHEERALSNKQFESMLDGICEWFDTIETKPSATAAELAKETYIHKLDRRVATFLSMDVGKQVDKLLATGSPYGSLHAIVEIYKQLIEREWGQGLDDQIAMTHGDLCFSNILYDKRSKLLKFIDPRGAETEEQLWGSPYYDVAKLSHSILGGYDFINNDLFEIRLDENLRLELELKRPVSAEREHIFLSRMEALGFNPSRIRLYEASLFLSMLPLHAESPKKLIGFILSAVKILEALQAEKRPSLLQRVMG
jgi:hypothetical protein